MLAVSHPSAVVWKWPLSTDSRGCPVAGVIAMAALDPQSPRKESAVGKVVGRTAAVYAFGKCGAFR